MRKDINWEIVSKDKRFIVEIAKELKINEKTIRRNLKKMGLKKEVKITKFSRKVNHFCKECGKQISRGSEKCISCATKGRKAWNNGRKSPETSGKNSVHWKGGKIKHSGGYILIKSLNNPNKDKSGYVLEHRLVVEKKIGRKLLKSERVHHLNEIKTDNRIENLMLFPNDSEHIKFHTKIRQFGMTNPIKRQIENRWKNLK